MEGHNIPLSSDIMGSNQARTGVDRGWVSYPVSQSLSPEEGLGAEFGNSPWAFDKWPVGCDLW